MLILLFKYNFVIIPRVCLFSLILSGCSVKPLYEGMQVYHDVSNSFSNIDIDVIAERDGQILRSHLIDSFRDVRFTKKHCRLNVVLSWKEREFAISPDGNAKRVLFTYTAHIILQDKDRKIIVERDINASTSYNISHSHGEVTLSLYGRHNDHLLKELCTRIVENIRMVLENES